MFYKPGKWALRGGVSNLPQNYKDCKRVTGILTESITDPKESMPPVYHACLFRKVLKEEFN